MTHFFINNKPYSLPYRIYRRVRFICYLNTRRRNKLKEKREVERTEVRDARRKEHEFIRLERKQRRHKARKIHEEMARQVRDTRSELQGRQKEALVDIKRMKREEKRKQIAERALRRKKMKRLARYVAIIRYRKAVTTIKSISFSSLQDLFLRLYEKRGITRDFLVILVNSTVMFILSYLILYLVSQFSSILAASFYDYPAILYYDQVYFNISAERWFRDSVQTIFMAGPAIVMIIGTIFLILFNRMKEENYLARLFLIWGFMHSIAMLFGGLLVGNIFETGLGHVIAWAYVSDAGRIVYSGISLFIIGFTGFLSAKNFILTANSYFNNINQDNRGIFLFAQIILPFILGSLIMFLIRQPVLMIYETLTMLTLVLAVIPLSGKVYSLPEMYFDEERKSIRPAWAWAGALIAAILFYRVILAYGIRFNQ